MSALSPGNKIGPYEITREIGRGGMGVVYLARDTKLDRDVAIKCLPDELAKDTDRLQRFEREAKLLASLNHPNIATIYGLEEVDGKRYLILEYIEGKTLEELLSGGAIAIDEAIPIAIQIAEAIEAAHDKGVIHRDLKPANIKFTSDDQVKVLDFGLAKALDDRTSSITNIADSPTVLKDASPTLPGVILGTAGYLSPEQARGRPIDKRTDIFSFGCVLYEMLTGLPPFPGETAADSIGATLHKEVDFIQLPSDTPTIVRHVLNRCLKRDRKDRLRDIGDVRLELDDALRDPLGASDALMNGASDGRRLLTIVAFLAMIVGALIAVTAVWFVVGASSDRIVRRYELKLPHDGQQPPESPVISPDGSLIVYKFQNQLWVRDLANFESRALDGTANAMEPFWSPNSEWIGFGQGLQLMKISMSNGTPQHVTTMPRAIMPAGGGAWLEDGTIVFTTGGTKLLAVSSLGGTPSTWLPMSSGEIDFHDVSALPSGKGVLFIVHPFKGTRFIAASDGERRTVVLKGDELRPDSPVYVEPGFVLYILSGSNAGIWAIPFSNETLEATGKPFLLIGGSARASASSDGTLSYLRNARFNDSTLAWFDLKTGESKNIGDPLETLTHPSASPDGSKIVYRGGDSNDIDIWILDLKLGNRSRITFSDDLKLAPCWSPDGKRIAVTQTGSDPPGVYIYATDGSGPTGQIIDGEFASFDPKWTAACVTRMGAGDQHRDIWHVPLDAPDEARPLIATPANEDFAQVSPDGDWMLYLSDESGRDEVFITRFPSGEGKWQVSTEGGIRPIWGPKSDRIYFVDTEARIMEIELDTTAGVRAGTPRRLFLASEYGLRWYQGWELPAPGDRFLSVRPSEEDAAEVTIGIVENWYEEFRKR